MDSRYPNHLDSYQGGYPRGYPPGGSPKHPGSGALFEISSVVALVRLNGRRYSRRLGKRLASPLLFSDVEIGRHARIRRAIIDKRVKIPDNTVIGYDPDQDRKRFTLSAEGIVVITKGTEL